MVVAGAGPSSTFVQACNVGANPNCTGIDRLFEVHPGGSLTMSGVTVRKGNAADRGGGIRNVGTLTLTNVVLDGNRSVMQGGGLENSGDASSATLTNVTVANNQASSGGGIRNSSSQLTLTNVTLSGNTASSILGAGALQQEGDISNTSATLANVTIAGNTADDLAAGGISVVAGTVTLRNSIVASNTVSDGVSSNCAIGNNGTFSSQGFNLIFPGAGCGLSAGTNDLVDADPKLGLLAANGGPTPTMALLAGSAAIDAGNPALPLNGQGGRCPAADQRGQARTDGNNDGTVRCDIGAFEIVPLPADLAVTLTDGVSTPSPGASLTYTLTITNPSTTAIQGIAVAATFPAPLTNVSWTCNGAGGSICAPASGSGNIAGAANVAASGSLTYTVQAAIPVGTANGTQIAATATITPPAGVADPSSANNSAADTDTVIVTVTPCGPRPTVAHPVEPAGPGRVQAHPDGQHQPRSVHQLDPGRPARHPPERRRRCPSSAGRAGRPERAGQQRPGCPERAGREPPAVRAAGTSLGRHGTGGVHGADDRHRRLRRLADVRRRRDCRTIAGGARAIVQAGAGVGPGMPCTYPR